MIISKQLLWIVVATLALQPVMMLLVTGVPPDHPWMGILYLLLTGLVTGSLITTLLILDKEPADGG